MNDALATSANTLTTTGFFNQLIDFFEKGGLFMGIILLVWGLVSPFVWKG